MSRPARDNNPCYNESQASLKCQISNPGDTDACQRFVDNYKLCLDFWKNVRIARRAKNLSPEMPFPQDWPKYKEKYKLTFPKVPTDVD